MMTYGTVQQANKLDNHCPDDHASIFKNIEFVLICLRRFLRDVFILSWIFKSIRTATASAAYKSLIFKEYGSGESETLEA